MQYGIKQYIFVIRELTAREIKRKYSRSVLGILWSVLNPLLFMGLMSIVFWEISKSSTYPVYYIISYTIWSMFNVATKTSITAFEDNKNLFQKTKLPRLVFVLSRNYTAFVNMLFSFVALLISLCIFRIMLSPSVIMFFIAALFELMFSIGVSIILASLYVFYKDVKFLWENIIVLLVHMLAIYMPIEVYPESIRYYMEINPLFIFADVARMSILEKSFELDRMLVMAMWAVGSFIIGLVVFKSLENKIVEKI